MKRKFITNLGFLLVLNLFVKPIYVFGIDLFVQRTVGAEAYGRYFFMFSIALIFQIFLDLGIENFIRREISKHPEKASGYLSNIVFLKLFLFIPYFLICFGIAFMKGIPATDLSLLFFILFNQFLASLILYIRANLGGFQLFRTESIVSVLDRGLMILIVGTLLLYPLTSGNFRIEWFVYAQTISYGAVLAAGSILLLKKTGRFSIRFSVWELLPILNQIRPYALLVLLMGIYYRAETIFLGLLLPDGELQIGIYAYGFRILDFLTNYALLFPILLLPMFSKSLHQRLPVGGLLELAVVILLVPSIAALAPAILYRNEIFEILNPEHSHLSAITFSILTISYLGMCISYTFGALLTANGNLKQLNIMAATAVLLSACLNLILVPRYKVVGAAMANAGTQLFTLLIHILLARNIFHFRLRLKLLFRFAIFGIFMVAGCILMGRTELHWLTGSVILSVSGISFALLTGLLNIRSFMIIIKQRET